MENRIMIAFDSVYGTADKANIPKIQVPPPQLAVL
jgi:hypothetical protein